MALNAAIQWEVRPTNGGANNGGGFRSGASGTDFSQQNAAQIAFTDLVIGATNTQLTSAANPFGATHVGNIIAITGGTGFTTGLYEVSSVAGSTATMDRAVGTAGSTGGTGNLGGARSGFSNGTTTLQSSLVAENIVWVKNEAWNEAVSLTVGGAAGAPIIIEGYNTSRGDTPTGANRPRNNRAGAGTVGISVVGAHQLRNLWVSNAGTIGINTTSATVLFINCRSSNNGTTGLTDAFACIAISCEFDNNTTNGVTSSTTLIGWGLSVHDNALIGLTTPFAVAFSLIYANGSHGINAGATNPRYFHNTIDANTGATTDGVNIGTSGIGAIVGNNITNNGRYGANATDADSIWWDYNNYFGNATAARNGTGVDTGANDQAVNPGYISGTNLAMVSPALRGLGFPGAFPDGVSVGYLDIGAVQRREAPPHIIGG